MLVPSPTHVRHGDVSVSSAVRSLRRSLSRSPSKFNMAGKTTPPIVPDDGQASGPSNSPQSPSLRYSPALATMETGQVRPEVERRREQPTATPSQRKQPSFTPASIPPSVFVQTAQEDHSTPGPFATPLRQNVKLSLRSAKSSKPLNSTPSRLPARPRASPRSPLKRALSGSSDAGNSTPSSTGSNDRNGDRPKNLAVPTSPLQRRCLERAPRPHSLHIDVSGASQAMFRALNTPDHPPTPSGTLKRSDATMDLDTGNVASPVAKRRSLHGISSLTHDANIFENAITATTAFDIYDESANQEYQLTGSDAQTTTTTATTTPLIFRRDPLPSPTPSPNVARRSSSLRKSTLQQRHGDKGSWGRRAGVQQLAQLGDVSTPIARNNRPRLSLDQFVPPILPNESPFTAARPLPNPSLHTMDRPAGHQPHPLSRSVKVSTSGNRLLDDTPMKPPAPKISMPAVPFQPVRALSRSIMSEMGVGSATASTPLSNPEPRRAFMSTGLVSKMQYNPDDDKRPVIPETPSKKPHGTFGTYPPGSHSHGTRGSGRRDTGSPVARFADRGKDLFGGSGRSLALFQKLGANRHFRRGSVLGLDDESKSSSSKEASRAPECNIPPTPTKILFTPAPTSTAYGGGIESPTANRRVPLSAVRPTHPDFVRESSCKFEPHLASYLRLISIFSEPRSERRLSQNPARGCG
jgi:mitosis inhibitor protein kinase SWE1